MDENQIGPNMNTTPVQRYVRDGPYPSGKSSASATGRSWVQTPVGSVYRTVVGRIRDTMGKFLFLFFFCFFFFALTLSSLFAMPLNKSTTYHAPPPLVSKNFLLHTCFEVISAMRRSSYAMFVGV